MSKYYKIKGLKVRVSDHEPNYSLNKIRGGNDIILYTRSADNKKLKIESQINRFLETPLAQQHGIVKSDFNKILGKKDTSKDTLTYHYKMVDKWFKDTKNNSELIKDLKINTNWFVPPNFNAKQKQSWLKYVNKKLKSIE